MFLANADKSPGDVAGRAMALVAMARYADEGAVAQSAGSFHALSPGGELPWSTDAPTSIGTRNGGDRHVRR